MPNEDRSKRFSPEGGTITPSQCAYCRHNHGETYKSCAVYGEKPPAYWFSSGTAAPGNGPVCPDREEAY